MNLCKWVNKNEHKFTISDKLIIWDEDLETKPSKLDSLESNINKDKQIESVRKNGNICKNQ